MCVSGGGGCQLWHWIEFNQKFSPEVGHCPTEKAVLLEVLAGGEASTDNRGSTQVSRQH